MTDADNDELVPKLSPANAPDPIIDLLKKEVDQTLLIENLKLNPEERFRKMEKSVEFARRCQRAGEEARRRNGL